MKLYMDQSDADTDWRIMQLQLYMDQSDADTDCKIMQLKLYMDQSDADTDCRIMQPLLVVIAYMAYTAELHPITPLSLLDYFGI